MNLILSSLDELLDVFVLDLHLELLALLDNVSLHTFYLLHLNEHEVLVFSSPIDVLISFFSL